MRRDPHVEFDPVVVASVVGDRLDIMLRGRAISPSAIEEIALLSDGEPLACLTFKDHERDGAARLPDAPTLRQYGVTFIITRSMSDRTGQLALSAMVAAQGLPPRTERLLLNVEPPAADRPDGAPRVTVAEGAAAPLSRYVELPAPVVLQIERAELDAQGRITLGGWAVSTCPIVAVEVFLGDLRLGAAKVGLPREDVSAAFPAYDDAASSGFLFAGQVEGAGRPPPERVRVRVTALNGVSQDCVVPLSAAVRRRRQPRAAASPQAATPPRQPQPPSEAPEGALRLHCDEATLFPSGDLLISGWCVGDSLPVRIAVGVAGIPLGDAETGRDRPDVGRNYPDLPRSSQSGFRFRAKADGALSHGAPVDLMAEDARSRVRRLVHPLTVLAKADQAAGPDAGAPSPSGLKFNLDAPAVERGAAKHQVTGHLTIEGWVVASSVVDGIDVLLDGERLGAAYYGLARQDVAAALPEWPNALRSGFAFHCPPRALKDGEHVVTLDCRLADGGLHSQSFRIAVSKAGDAGGAGEVRRRLSRVEAGSYERTLTALDWDRRFVIALRDDAVAPGGALALTLGSLRGQAACRWALLIGEDAADAQALLDGRFADLAPRLLAGPPLPDDVVLPLSAGDELGCDALAELALAFAMGAGADLAYADETRAVGEAGERELFCKPDWSPELLMATDYIGRPWCVDAAVLKRAGISPDDMLALDDHDLLLRCTEHARAVRHVPALLCRSAMRPPSARAGSAVQAAADRRGLDAVAAPGRAPGAWRLTAPSLRPGIVSVIIPTCGAGEHIRNCIRKLRAHARGREIEVVAVDNIPDEQTELKEWLATAADVVLAIPEAFNWSRFNNRAAEAARGDYLLFLNDDVEATRDGWLDAMLELARQPDVGAVGAQLLYPDGKVQHAGMFLAQLGQARHAFRFLRGDDPGPFGLALTQRNVASVTGACLLVRREVFDAVGGFDEAHDVINNDLDFCLRLGAEGRRVVYTPDASLIHHELASRAALAEAFDTSRFESDWRLRFAAGDPYHAPGLSKQHDDFRPDDEPVRVVHGGHPLYARGEIGRILAVKVDHIGDFVTALPALRRLRERFPEARISLLCGRAAAAIAHLEDSVDEVIEFEFFHVKSALGRKDLESDELAALRERLAPYRFDLAIDLRKHLDTRELLRFTGATWLAGFDHLGQFPWLDVSLEWEGDRGLHAKRYHVTDDLLHLVDAVGTASETDRVGILPERLAAAAASLRLPADVEALFARPVVCIHAGAGNPLKQWPPEYFATLVDMLLRRRLAVLFVGGPDEAEVTQDIIDRVVAFNGPPRGDRIGSVVGTLKLRDLPAAISRCALYVGNDSGPKHIAAAVGVPTVGIHSGTVDPHEWAPMGKDAVAIHRSMSCSPCYIISADRCPRALACLTGIDPMAVMRVCERLLARRGPAAPPSATSAATEPREPEMPAAEAADGFGDADALSARQPRRRGWMLLARRPE